MMTQDPIDSGMLDWIWDGTLAARGYSDADLRTLARVLSRTCPHCGAETGAYCANTGSGMPITDLDHQHAARRTPWRV